MATDLLLEDHLPEVPEPPKGRRPRRRTWIIGIVAFAAFAAVLGYLTGNEVQANTQFDQTHQFLDATRQGTAIVVTNLVKVRRELALVNDQVGSAKVALAQDASELKAAQTALVNAQSHVSQQTTMIGALNVCLGGVEQALTALSVNDQTHAIDALNSVSSSCAEVGGSSG